MQETVVKLQNNLLLQNWLQELELLSESARITLTEIVEVVEFLRKKQYQI